LIAISRLKDIIIELSLFLIYYNICDLAHVGVYHNCDKQRNFQQLLAVNLHAIATVVNILTFPHCDKRGYQKGSKEMRANHESLTDGDTKRKPCRHKVNAKPNVRVK